MAGKVGCALLLAVLFAAAAVSRTSFAVFLASLAVLLVGFLAWYVRTLRRDVTVTLQLPARPVHPDEDFAVLVKLHNNGRRPVPELRVVLQAVDAESGTAIDRPRASNARPYKITGTSIRKDTYVYTLYYGRALLFRHGVDAEF